VLVFKNIASHCVGKVQVFASDLVLSSLHFKHNVSTVMLSGPGRIVQHVSHLALLTCAHRIFHLVLLIHNFLLERHVGICKIALAEIDPIYACIEGDSRRIVGHEVQAWLRQPGSEKNAGEVERE
jgi:hypothetical protein